MAKLVQKFRTGFANPGHCYWLVVRRLGSEFSNRFSHILKYHALAPETINIYPTFRCNLRCAICFVRFYNTEKELDYTDWLRIIEKVKNFHPRIHLSGGEPFVYPKIIDLIERIKEHRLYLHITTNGTYLTEYADKIIKLKVNRLDISIDGTKEVHDRIRGVPGIYDRIMAGLERIVKLRARNRLPVVRINSIINFEDFKPMAELMKICQDWKIEAIQFIYPLYLKNQEIKTHRKYLKATIGSDINYWGMADHHRLSPKNLEQTWQIIQMLNKPWPVKVEVFPKFNKKQFKAYYDEKEDFYSFIKGDCRALWNTATILPSGDVESCPDYIIGNCCNEDFLRLWNSQAMRSLRRCIKSRKFFSVCRACCFFYL